MLQESFDDGLILDEADDPPDSPALRTGQGIKLIDLLDQPGVVFPAFL